MPAEEPNMDQQDPLFILNEVIPRLIHENESQNNNGVLEPATYERNRRQINNLTNFAKNKLDAQSKGPNGLHRPRQGGPPQMPGPRQELGQGPPPQMGGPRPGPWLAGRGPPAAGGPQMPMPFPNQQQMPMPSNR